MSNESISIFVYMIGIIGIGLFVFGCYKLMTANDEDHFKKFLVPILGVIFILIGVTLAFNLNEKNQSEIEQQIVMKLNTVSENIIVEDQSESSGFFFPNTNNQDIKKVYFDGKTYKVQIEKNKVVKIVEVVE